jgi:hypothetical protein
VPEEVHDRMNWNLADPRRRHYTIAAGILLAGLIGAAVVYLRAVAEPPIPMEFSAKTSKQYRHDLEVFGGTANVLAVRFMDWFSSLWHGRSLALTVALLSLATALGYLFFTEVLPPLPDAELSDQDHHGPG